MSWKQDASCVEWFHPWEKLLDWNPPYAKWYVGGKLNASYNCLDRQTKEAIALIWESETGAFEEWSYGKLLQEVCNFAHELKERGIEKGDAVAIYMPMIPEAVVAMLACSRIGAVHNVVFAGFAPPALHDRIVDSNAKLVITSSSTHRGGKVIELEKAARIAAQDVPVRVYNRGETLLQAKMPCQEMDSEDLLFFLYTSGTTGKPKGVVHSTAGYLVRATRTCQQVFDLKPKSRYWCTADIGWITGHTYVVYGPLSCGASVFLYEGAIEKETCWRLIEKHALEVFYTAPTAIRMFMQWGDAFPAKYDLSSLRILGSVGEPLNPEAWEWYNAHIGKQKCPIMDTWWQTETGSIMISPTPEMPLKAGSCAKPLPGIEARIENGKLLIDKPWPSMLRGIYNDPKRYEETYWENGSYVTGDSARQDEEGYFWLLGRNDDVINVSGHRLGSAEIESALVEYPSVAEAAVVGVPHLVKGEQIIAFVVERDDMPLDPEYECILKRFVAQSISPIARPERIVKVKELPKTRSGKIIRRLLKGLIEGQEIKEITTLANPTAIEAITAELS